MFCPNCGASAPENTAFCPGCGTALTVQQSGQPGQPQQPQQPMYQQPVYGQPPYGVPAPVANPFPMKWFKFLIYFALFAGGILNAINGITTISGSQYGGYADLVYAMFGGLQALDTFVGVAMIAIAALQIFTRFRLAGYYKNGPKLLLLVYAAVVVLNIVQVIGAYAILPSEVNGSLNISSIIANTVVNGLLVFANYVYFNKRKDLFQK